MNEKQQKAKEIMPEYLKIIESDLMKVAHYLKDGVKVAIVMQDDKLAEQLAQLFVEADELKKRFMLLTRKIVD